MAWVAVASGYLNLGLANCTVTLSGTYNSWGPKTWNFPWTIFLPAPPSDLTPPPTANLQNLWEIPSHTQSAQLSFGVFPSHSHPCLYKPAWKECSQFWQSVTPIQNLLVPALASDSCSCFSTPNSYFRYWTPAPDSCIHAGIVSIALWLELDWLVTSLLCISPIETVWPWYQPLS